MNIFRGDTFLKDWKVKTSNGEDYIFQKGDIIRYCLYKDVDKPIQKKEIIIEEEQQSVEIFYSHEETSKLQIGNYVLEIELTYDKNKVQTFKYTNIYVDKDAIC